MAFVCTVRDFPPEVVNGQVVVPIGYDDKDPINYSLLMGFEPMAGGDPEFFWVILAANTEDDSVTEYWSGLETRHIFAKTDRLLVRSLIMTMIEVLLVATRPERFFCCTHDSDLPEKALSKHVVIAAIFKTCGYDVVREPVQLGKVSWWAELKK